MKQFLCLRTLALSIILAIPLVSLVSASASADSKHATCLKSCVKRYNNCIKATDDTGEAKECMGHYDSCRDYCDAGGSGVDYDDGSRVGGTASCPPGTRRNPLGICVVSFTLAKEQPDCEPGHDDGCRIRVTVDMLPKPGGTVIFCPRPMMPMPGQPGCRPMVDTEDRSDRADGRNCPAGWAPGPDDRCVPVVRPGLAGEYDMMVEEFVGAGAGDHDMLRRIHKVGQEAGIWATVPEAERAVENTAEALGPDWERE